MTPLRGAASEVSAGVSWIHCRRPRDQPQVVADGRDAPRDDEVRDEREQHARWAERYQRLMRETRGLERRVENRTNSIARRFDKVCEVLGELGYLASSGDATTVTDSGRMLMRLYTESDLLAAQSLPPSARKI